MKVSAKQHIVLREPTLLDVIQTASLRWDGISAKYYDSIDQVLRVRPFGVSWLLLYLDSDPEKLETGLKRLTVNPDWRDLNWILFTDPSFSSQATTFKEEFTQIKQVVQLPCTADTLAQVYAELLDPKSPPPKVRAADKKASQALPPIVEKKAVMPVAPVSPVSQETLPPPPRFSGVPIVPSAQSPSFAPVKMGAPAMPPPPQGLEKFIGKSGSLAKLEPSPPGVPGASASQQTSSTASTPATGDEVKLPPLVPVAIREPRPASLDDRLEELFRIYPTITDYVIQNSELEIVRLSSEAAKVYSDECTVSMKICVKIGQEFGFGNVIQFDHLSHSKAGVFFSLNPTPENLTLFRVVLLLSKKGADLAALANHLRKTI